MTREAHAAAARLGLGLGTAALLNAEDIGGGTAAAAAAQAFAIQRANHTGTQVASTISDFTAAVLALSPWAQSTADVTVNNSTTPVSVTGLTLAMAASSVYQLTAYVEYSASTAGDIGLTWTVPTGTTMRWTVNSASTTGTTSTNSIHRGGLAQTSSGPCGGIGAGTKIVAQPIGSVTTSTTAGNLVLNFAQAVADPTDAVVYTKSWVLLQKRA